MKYFISVFDGGCQLTPADVHIYRFKSVVWRLQEFAVIKWCVQQTPVVTLHCVSVSGFIFYA